MRSPSPNPDSFLSPLCPLCLSGESSFSRWPRWNRDLRYAATSGRRHRGIEEEQGTESEPGRVAPVHVRNPDGIGIGGAVRGERGLVCGCGPSRFNRDGSPWRTQPRVPTRTARARTRIIHRETVCAPPCLARFEACLCDSPHCLDAATQALRVLRRSVNFPPTIHKHAHL